MRPIILSGLLCLAMATAAAAQTPDPSPKGVTNAASLVSPVSPASTGTYIRPVKNQRFSRYYKSMFGLGALGKNVAGAGFSTLRNSTVEWGPHWKGFGKRVASNIGKSVIKNTTVFALEEAFKLDSRYIRSEKGAGAKIKNALTSPIIARNQDGKKVFGFPSIIGTYTASVISYQTWYPKRYGWKDGVRSGTISLGTNALFNLVKEFVHKK